MLKGAGLEIFPSADKRAPMLIVSGHLDMTVTRHPHNLPWKRKASFFAQHLMTWTAPADFGIDYHKFASRMNSDNDDAFQLSELICRKTDSEWEVHRVAHFLNECRTIFAHRHRRAWLR